MITYIAYVYNKNTNVIISKITNVTDVINNNKINGDSSIILGDLFNFIILDNSTDVNKNVGDTIDVGSLTDLRDELLMSETERLQKKLDNVKKSNADDINTLLMGVIDIYNQITALQTKTT